MNRSRSLTVALASVVLGGGALAIAGFALAASTPHQAALQCVPSASQAKTCSLKLSTFPDSLEGAHGANGGPHPDWVSYSNDNIVVPANTTVNVTIDQYDGGGALNNAFFDHVWGTVGGTYTVDGKTLTHYNPNQVGHTFTLRGIPGNGKTLFVSVPLPLNPSAKTPVKIAPMVPPTPWTPKASSESS